MTRSALISIAMSLFAACSSADGGGSSGGGGGSGGGADEGTTCSQILACIGACTIAACADTCVADGSNEAQDQINDLVGCIEQNACTDSACLAQHCNAQLATCNGDSGGGGGQQGTPLPAQLVGTWDHTAAGVSITFQLTADGRVSKVAGLATGSGSCDSSFVFQYDGIVQLSGDKLSFLPTTGSFTSYGCDGTTPSNSGPRTDPEHFRFVLGSDAAGPLLQLQTIETGNVVEYRRQ